MPHTTHEPAVPSDRDALLAREACRVLGQARAGEADLRMQILDVGQESTMLYLPPAAAALLRTMLKEMAAGRAVSIVPIDAEITTGQAAKLLHVSRPFVVSLIDKGLLPARMVGAHRRMRLVDVLTFKRESKTRARAALAEMVAISQELGLE